MMGHLITAFLASTFIGVPAGMVIRSLCRMAAKCAPPDDGPDTEGMGMLTFRDVGDGDA